MHTLSTKIIYQFGIKHYFGSNRKMSTKMIYYTSLRNHKLKNYNNTQSICNWNDSGKAVIICHRKTVITKNMYNGAYAIPNPERRPVPAVGWL